MELEDKKINWSSIILVGFILLVVVFGLIVVFHKDTPKENVTKEIVNKSTQTINSSAQLYWNNTMLTDSTTYNKATNTCYASRYGMNIEIKPCLAQDIDGRDIQQDVIFKWNGTQARNIAWVFVYEQDLESGKIEVLENTSRVIQTLQNTWVNNYVVDSIVSYVNLTSKPSQCDLGNLNNTQFYNVSRNNNPNGTYVQTICFTTVTPVNATAFRISGNADLPQDKTIYEMNYVDETSSIINGNGLLADNKSYYTTYSHLFNINDVEYTKWTYTPKNKTKSGKWHIVGYDKDIGLFNSLSSDQYIYIDPWWNRTWTNCFNLSVNNTLSTAREDTVIDLPINVVSFTNKPYNNSIAVTTLGCNIENSTEIPSGVYDINQTNGLMSNFNLVISNITFSPNENKTLGVYYKDTSITRNQAYKLTSSVNNGVVNITATTFRTLFGYNATYTPYYGAMFETYVNNGSTWLNYSSSISSDYTSKIDAFYNSPIEEIITIYSQSEQSVIFNRLITGKANVTYKVYSNGYVKADARNLTANEMYIFTFGENVGYSRLQPDNTITTSDANGLQVVGSAFGLGDKTASGLHIAYFNQSKLSFGVGSTDNTMRTIASRGWFLYNNPSSNSVMIDNNHTIVLKPLPTSNVTKWINIKEDLLNPITVFSIGGEESYNPLSSPEFTFVSQYPPDIITTNIVNTSVMIQYNITHTSGINTSTVNLFWLTNGTNHKNFTWYINGTIPITGFSSQGVSNFNISNTWNFTLGDNIYPATYLLNLSQYDNSLHNTFNLTTDNYLIKALVLNMTNNTQYNLLEYVIENMTSTVASLRIYYCNSTYSTGNVGTDLNCGLVANMLNNQTYNHIENQSRHYLEPLAINITTGTLGNVKVTQSGYFVFRGRTGGWSAYTVPFISRTSAMQTSTNTGTTWSDLTETLDYHLHQFDIDDTFNYYVCGNATTNGIYNCSAMRSDSLNKTHLPPSPPIVYNPANQTYNGNITINYTASLGTDNISIMYYSIYLYNSDDTFNQTIKANNSLNLSYIFDSKAVNIITGSFNIHVYATDTTGLNAFGESEVFSINNTYQTTTAVTSSPGSPIDYGTASTFDCTNDYSLPTTLYINGVNKSNEKGVSIIRKAGTYIVNCSAGTSTLGNLIGSSQQITYIINKAASAVSISVSPSNNENYGTETTVSGADCPSQLTCTLTRAGTTVSNPDVQTLNAGSYLYNYSTNGNENYTGSSSVSTLTINKINPSLAITMLPGTTVTNGTQTTVTGSGCPGSCILKRDNVVVGNPEVTTLPLGSYVYNYSFVGSTNYNVYSVTSTLNVNPIQFAGNNGSINFTIISPFVSNLTQTLSFQVPFHFVTHAYMNLSGGQQQVGFTGNFTYLINGTDKVFIGIARNTSNYIVMNGTGGYTNLLVYYLNGTFIRKITLSNSSIDSTNIMFNTTTITLLENFGGDLWVHNLSGSLLYKSSPFGSSGTYNGISSNGTNTIVTSAGNPTNFYVLNSTNGVIYSKSSGINNMEGLTYSNGYFIGFKDTANPSTGSIYLYNANTLDLISITSNLNMLNVAGITFNSTKLTKITSTDIYDSDITLTTPYNINVSLDDKQIYFYPGPFNQSNNQTNNFYTAMNSYLSDCTFVGSYCIVPITFHSDTVGILNYSDFRVDNLGFINNSITYASPVLSGALVNITANLTIPIAPTSVILNYAGMNYTSTILSSGIYYNIINNFVIPPSLTNVNNTFYFIIISNNTYYTTGNYSQSVLGVSLTTTCSAGTFDLVNFSNYNEETLASMSGTVEYILSVKNNNIIIAQSNGTATGTSTKICTTQNLSNFGTTYSLQLRYYTPTFAYKTYNVQDNSVSNIPITIPLYYIPTSNSTQFIINYVDFNYLTHPGAIIQIQRQYLTDNTYKVVEIPLISSDGSAKATFNTNNIRYKALVIDNGILIDTLEDIFPVCQNVVLGTCILSLRGAQSNPVTAITDFSYTLSQNSNTITLTYVIPSGTPKQVEFITEQNSRFLSNITTCSSTLFASGGTITCPYNETIGDSLLNLRVDVDGVKTLFGNILIAEQLNDIFLGNNYFIAFILLLTLILIFASSGIWKLVAGGVGVVYLGVIFLIRGVTLTTVASSFAWLIIAIVLAIFEINKHEENYI